MKRSQSLEATARLLVFAAAAIFSRSQETQSDSSRLQGRRLSKAVADRSRAAVMRLKSLRGKHPVAYIRISLHGMRRSHSLMKQVSAQAMESGAIDL